MRVQLNMIMDIYKAITKNIKKVLEEQGVFIFEKLKLSNQTTGAVMLQIFI